MIFYPFTAQIEIFSGIGPKVMNCIAYFMIRY